MDGVLVDTSQCHDFAYQALMNRLGLPIVDYGELAGRSTKSVVNEYLGHLSVEEQNECIAFKQQQALLLLKTADIVFSDTVQTIKTLHHQGFRLGLGTSASKNSVSLILDRLAVHHLFDVVVTADDVNNGKPSPEIFNKAIEGLMFCSNQVLIVEDSLAGLQAGLQSGAYVANVRCEIAKDRFGLPDRGYCGYYPDLASLVNELNRHMTQRSNSKEQGL